jgi:uncharacterized membrane protein
MDTQFLLVIRPDFLAQVRLVKISRDNITGLSHPSYQPLALPRLLAVVWNNWKAIARSFGYAFLGLGLVLLVMIIYAMTVRLMH